MPRAPSTSALKLAHADMTIRTAILDGRLILGDSALFAELTRALRREVSAGTRARVHRGQACRARRAAPAAGRVALSGRAQHQGRQGRAARPAYAALARQISVRARGRARGDGRTRFSRRRGAPPSAAARTSCGPCAATCISSPAGAEERLTFDVQPRMAERLGYARSSAGCAPSSAS